MKKSKMAAKMASDLKYILCLSRFATCPQSYNLFFYTMSATSFGFQYRHCDFVKKKTYSHVGYFREFAIQKCPNISNLFYGIAPVCFK